MSAVALPRDDAALEQAFPSIPCNHRPNGPYVVVQIRMAKDATDGGIILSDPDKETEKDNTQVGRVVAIGVGCFKERQGGNPWPEGDWFAVGDYVRCPKYGGDRWSVRFTRARPATQRGNLYLPGGTERIAVEFAIFKDLDLRACVDDPLAVEAYF